MFQSLRTYYDTIQNHKILDLFEDSNRFENFTVSAGDLTLDYSKTNIDDMARKLLLELADERNVPRKRDEMFAGKAINDTEDRAVLHTALRAPRDAVIMENGQNVVPEIHKSIDAMVQFCDAVRSGEITASNGEAFTDVVNIGIGGSDLGPVMATIALAPYHNGPRTHFVSNVDGAHITDILKNLNPETTLVLIASKTFTTIETLTNAQTAREWLSNVKDAGQHFAAISTAEDKTSAFGISSDRVFGFEDWVGGRYSLWGPIGLSIMLAIGADAFREFLDGAHKIDQHFQTAEGSENAALILALTGIWHRNICGYPTRAVLPYEQRLLRLPAYLQQLDMESNGKSVRKNGHATEKTGPVVWGEPGTNGQHAFYQLIHQGTDVIPCEFLIAKEAHEPSLSHQHDLLKANCLAQSRALLIGRDLAEARKISQSKGYTGAEAERQAAHRVFSGNRPSLTLTYPKLTPSVLGQIIALYEHRVFVEGAIWGINSFDQWGVELGKELAVQLLPAVEGKEIEGLDGSTRGLLALLK